MIAVVGIGNSLLRDDGFGIHIIEELKNEMYDENIEIIDGGTYIFDLLDIFIRKEKIIIIDTIKGGHSPGTIYKVAPEELGTYIGEKSSLHDVQILDLLKDVNLLGYFPKVTIIGIEPKEIFFDLDLSKEIKERIPEVLKQIKEEIGDLCA